MKKFRLLLLDANVVILICQHGLWEQIIARCEIHLARTVIDEAHFYIDGNGDQQPIDLTPYIQTNAITVFDLKPSELDSLRAQFDITYFEKLDPGELESLAYLLRQDEACRICSADKIVFRVLGNMKCADQGVSLEEVLNSIGLGRTLPREYCREYREHWTRQGFREGLSDIGMRDDS